jgi:hypothetical protein
MVNKFDLVALAYSNPEEKRISYPAILAMYVRGTGPAGASS